MKVFIILTTIKPKGDAFIAHATLDEHLAAETVRELNKKGREGNGLQGYWYCDRELLTKQEEVT